MQVISNSGPILNLRYIASKNFYLCVYIVAAGFLLSRFDLSVAAQTGEALSQDIPLNQIVEIKLPENASTVLLGNPDIADILSQGRSAVVIGGKRIGQTNLLVKDRDQNVIGNIEIAVSAANTRTITIFRGPERTDFACSQSCEMLKTESKDNQATLVLKQGDAKK